MKYRSFASKFGGFFSYTGSHYYSLHAMGRTLVLTQMHMQAHTLQVPCYACLTKYDKVLLQSVNLVSLFIYFIK